MSARSVRGRIALPPEIPLERARAVRIQVEDTSRLDAPSIVVAEQCLEDIDLESAAEVPYCVDVPDDAVEVGKRYSVRVHVDVNGTGDVTTGDYVSTAAYPVLAGDDCTDDVTITVRRV